MTPVQSLNKPFPERTPSQPSTKRRWSQCSYTMPLELVLSTQSLLALHWPT